MLDYDYEFFSLTSKKLLLHRKALLSHKHLQLVDFIRVTMTNDNKVAVYTKSVAEVLTSFSFLREPYTNNQHINIHIMVINSHGQNSY